MPENDNRSAPDGATLDTDTREQISAHAEDIEIAAQRLCDVSRPLTRLGARALFETIGAALRESSFLAETSEPWRPRAGCQKTGSCYSACEPGCDHRPEGDPS